MSQLIILVGGNLVLWQCAEQDLARQRGGWLLTACYLESHGAVQTDHPSTGHGIEQHTDVTMSDNPFGMLLVILYRNTVQQVKGAIAATGTDDGLDGVVFQCPYQVFGTLVGRTCIGVDIQIVGVRT